MSLTDTLDVAFERDMDYQTIDERIEKLRKISLAYLEGALLNHEGRAL